VDLPIRPENEMFRLTDLNTLPMIYLSHILTRSHHLSMSDHLSDSDMTNPASITLPMIPLRALVPLPGEVITIAVGRAKSIAAVRAAMMVDGRVGLTVQRDPNDDAILDIDVLHPVAIIGKVARATTNRDGTLTITTLAAERAYLRRIEMGPGADVGSTGDIVDGTIPSTVYDRAILVPILDAAPESSAVAAEIDASVIVIRELASRLAGIVGADPRINWLMTSDMTGPGTIADAAAVLASTIEAETIESRSSSRSMSPPDSDSPSGCSAG
jgi:ATP-dependent Lon protease